MESEGVSTRGAIASKMVVGGIEGGENAKGKVSEDGVRVVGLDVRRWAVGWQMNLQFTGVGGWICSSGIEGDCLFWVVETCG